MLILDEAKADQEKFIKGLKDDIKSKGYDERKVESDFNRVYKPILDYFYQHKNSIKAPQNDIYYGMKNETPKDFREFVNDFQVTIDSKKATELKAKEGAKLLYSDSDWKVYHITTPEASQKYGKGTKGCISGTKEDNFGGSEGVKYFDRYTKEGIEFYFFINKDGNKYAIAQYPDGKHSEIFNAQDSKVSFIPNAPQVKEIKVNYSRVDDKGLIINAFLSEQIPFNILKETISGMAADEDREIITYNNAEDFCQDLDTKIPDGYLEFYLARAGEYDANKYEEEFGFNPLDEDWTGDIPEIDSYYLNSIPGETKAEKCDPKNFSNYKYFILSSSWDTYYSVILCKDYGEFGISLNEIFDVFNWDEDTLDDFYQDYADESLTREDVIALMCTNTLIGLIQQGKVGIGILTDIGCSREYILNIQYDSKMQESLIEKLSEYEPTKKGIAYKVFKVKNGKLYPPMVANKNNEDTPIGVWLDAEEGEFAGLSKTGRPQVKSTGSGTLSYRPGWHLGDVPRASQFDRKNKETGEMEFPKDFVGAECEYAMDIDYQPESDARGYERTKVDDKGNVITYKSDKYQHSLAGVPHLPTKGYYKYRTNPNPDTVPWVITGQMKVNRLLDDFEVNEILKRNGIAPIHRQGGDKTIKELGINTMMKENYRNLNGDKIPDEMELEYEDLGIRIIDDVTEYTKTSGPMSDYGDTGEVNLTRYGILNDGTYTVDVEIDDIVELLDKDVEDVTQADLDNLDINDLYNYLLEKYELDAIKDAKTNGSYNDVDWED